VTVPSKADIEKRQKKLEQFKKHLDTQGRVSEKKLCSDLRSAIRAVWMKHDTKLSYLYEHTIPDMNPETRTKWLVQCECCKEMFKLGDVEINHKVGEHSLKTLEDVLPFAQSILGVSYDDIEILCKGCHSIFTYSERYGMDFESAKKEKLVIEKINQTVAKQKKELLAAGFKAADISNEEKRREAYRKLLGDNNDTIII
jgi:hypothetical protein